MKKLKIAAALAAVTVLLAGCGSQPTQSQSKYDFTMPDPPTEFVTTTIVGSGLGGGLGFEGKVPEGRGTP